ncbi:MAG: MG2 domain-containing protein, partial [Victivallaceae bacterium]|nr:MG2 domain-containing protein [Victivallaceae bacterium]
MAFNCWQYRKNHVEKAKPDNPASAEVEIEVQRELLLKTANFYEWSQRIDLDFDRVLGEFPAVPGWLAVSPEIKVETSAASGTLMVSGDFKPGVRYTLTVKKGLKAEDGAELRRDAVAVVRIPNATPAIAFAVNGAFLPAKSQKFLLPFTSTNVGRVKATLTRAYDNNLTPMNFGSGMRPEAEQEITVNAPKNQSVTSVVDLEKMLGSRPVPGVYRLTLQRAGAYWPSTDLLFTVSDLAISAACDNEAREIAVFVRRFSDNTPAAGATVEAISNSNQKVGAGVTGSDGTVKIAYLPMFDTNKDALRAILVRQGGEVSYLDLNNQLYTAASGRDFTPGRAVAMVFAERGVVRPGDKFAVSAFVRQPGEKDKSLPAEHLPVKFTLHDPSENQVAAVAGVIGMNGFAGVEFQLPPDAPVGGYTFRAELPDGIASGFIAVADFIPDRIKVKVASEAEIRKLDQPINYATDAEYYFGGKVDYGSFSGTVFAEPGANPAHWKLAPGWTVGDSAAFCQPSPLEWRAATFSGGLPVIQYPGFAAQGGKAWNPVQLTCSVTVAEPGGNGVSAFSSQTVFPSDWFIALGEDGAASSYGRRFGLRALAASPDGLTASSDMLVEFELSRVDWDYVLTWRDSRYHREWKRRLTRLDGFNRAMILPSGTNLGAFSTELEFGSADRPLASGCYVLTAKCGERIRTSMEFFHYTGDGNRPKSPAALVFRTDAGSYKPGDIATISFDSATDGVGLLTTGVAGFDEVRSFAVKAGRNQVKVNIPSGLERSSYNAALSVVTGVGSGIDRAFAVAELTVDQTANHRMKVELKAPELARPGENIEITLALSNPKSQPVSGTVRVWAVDEGILALTGYRTPDIFARFFGKNG